MSAPCGQCNGSGEVRVELGGHVYTFVSWVGCYVVRTEVTLPDYHEEGMWQP